MRKTLFLLILFLASLKVSAFDYLRAVKDEIPGGYNFWVYTPVDYFIPWNRHLSSSSCMGQVFVAEIWIG